MAKKKGGKKNSGGAAGGNAAAGGDGIMVDPSRVRFQHARIRPFFSGCGRRVEDTLDEIRQGKMKPSDLPPIQILLGPVDEATGEPWYFSLNNRRLWVLKRCREECLLPGNRIFARVRKPKSEQEALRYSLENCVLEAKIMPEKARGGVRGCKDDDQNESHAVEHVDERAEEAVNDGRVDGSSPDLESHQQFLGLGIGSSSDYSDTEGSDDEKSGPPNRFSALF
jgi:hypothetical protein